MAHQLDGGEVQAEIRDMDMFHPLTGQGRALGADHLKNDLAAGFVDKADNEESFVVKQGYFVGDSPHEALKRALKAEIEPHWVCRRAVIVGSRRIFVIPRGSPA